MYIVCKPRMALRLKWTASIITVLAFVQMTDGMKRILSKIKPSKETGVDRPCDIFSFKRGKFKQLHRPTGSPESLNLFDRAAISTAVRKEIRCNDAYYMLSYLYLANPHYYSYPEEVDDLHMKINTEYPEWTRKMLVTAFNVSQDETAMDVPWLLYLYVKRIEVHAHADKDPYKVFLPVLRTSHYGMYEVVSCTMFENDCTMFDTVFKRGRNFFSYMADMRQSKPIKNNFSKNSTKLLDILGKHWPDLQVNSSMYCCQNEASTSDQGPGVRPLTEEHLTLDLLYLNDVFENVRATTLLKDFGVFEDGDRLIRYLRERMFEIKSAGTPFIQYVLSLVDFHEHVQRALKTMMLRIYYDFLDKLELLNKDLQEDLVKQFLKPYKDWYDFLFLSNSDNGFYVSQMHKWWDNDNLLDITVPDLKQKVIDKLRENDNISKVLLYNYQSFQKIKIDKTLLMVIVHEYEILLDPRIIALEHQPTEPIQTTILCAEVLIGYMKKIFNDINFSAIQSLIKIKSSMNFARFRVYEPQYQSDVSSGED